jgi:trimeric autotransporter adhesin
MKLHRWLICSVVVTAVFSSLLSAQQDAPAQTLSVVPRQVNFSGKATDGQGKPIGGIAGITFSIYKDQYEGSPLWLETQNIQPDVKGNYTVQLGATKPEGMPLDLFTSGEARWLGVRVNSGEEQPRVLLLSVPYALKAADAETLGGKPLSAFQLAPQPNNGATQTSPTAAEQANEIVCASGTACRTGFVPLFSSNGGSASVLDSLLSQGGGTVTIAGNQTTAGNLNVGGQVKAETVVTTTSTGGVNSTMTGPANGIAAITGSATATGAAGFTFGVIGQSASNSGRGVWGLATGSGGIGVLGENNSGPGFGVTGKALPGSAGSGVYGWKGSSSSTGSKNTWVGTRMAGVWGDTGSPSSPTGPYVTAVLGTADDANAGSFYNTSSTGYDTMDVFAFGGKSYPFAAGNINEAGYGNSCNIDPAGNLNCTGSKNAVVPLDGGKRKVALSAIESPSNWFEDFGSAQLINGMAVVHLDLDFIQTVNTENDYKVFPVPNGDCKGLYVTTKTRDSFEVRELGGGTSNVRFDYRITAIRRNYETVRFADHSNDPDPRKIVERMREHGTKASSVPVMEPPIVSHQAQPHN